MNISRLEIESFGAIEPVIELLQKIFMWRRPGNFRFQTEFPEMYERWKTAAEVFVTSKDRDVRKVGVTMRSITKGLADVDKMPAGTWRYRLAHSKLGDALDRLFAQLMVLDEKEVSIIGI